MSDYPIAEYKDVAKREETLLFMAGDIEYAMEICQEYCNEVGWCVTVDETEYIYKGGSEPGFIVRAINYPRFKNQNIYDRMRTLADRLQTRLYQDSYTIHHGNSAYYFANEYKEKTDKAIAAGAFLEKEWKKDEDMGN